MNIGRFDNFDQINESDRTSELGGREIGKIPKDIVDYFSEYGTPLTGKFDLDKFAESASLTKDEAFTVLVNMDNEEVMQDIANGDYDSFDLHDSKQFNDEYDTMYDELFGEDGEA